jgi:hypothetical protein
LQILWKKLYEISILIKETTQSIIYLLLQLVNYISKFITQSNLATSKIYNLDIIEIYFGHGSQNLEKI